MKSFKKIDRKNLPMHSPLIGSLVLWIALDHWGAPGWAYGAIGLFLALVWIAFFIDLFGAESVDVLKK